jgi:galactitol-specific phosphotransferase system IIC component
MDSKVHDERLALEAPLFANNFRGVAFFNAGIVAIVAFAHLTSKGKLCLAIITGLINFAFFLFSDTAIQALASIAKDAGDERSAYFANFRGQPWILFRAVSAMVSIAVVVCEIIFIYA